MATTLSNFTIEEQLASSEETLISSGASEKKFIGSMLLFNTSSSAVEVTLWLILTATTGATGSGGNHAFVKTIPANTGLRPSDLFGQVIDNNMKLSGKASVADVVNILGSGTTET